VTRGEGGNCPLGRSPPPDPRQVLPTRGKGAWLFCAVRYTAQAVQAEVPMTAHGGKAGGSWPFLLSPPYGRRVAKASAHVGRPELS
jgi:hypothetical protein